MSPIRTAATYAPANVQLAYSGLIEVAAALQSYRKAMVLIGGWAPYLLLRQHPSSKGSFHHVGSIDSDWVVDPSLVNARQYDTIVDALQQRGFEQSPGVLYRFVKQVPLPRSAQPFTISVDLLTTSPPQGEGRGHRHREIQDGLRARTTPGAAIALAHHLAMQLEGAVLTGGQTRVEVQAVDAVGLIGTKGLAMGDRYREKDAYDLYSVIGYYGEGPPEVAAMTKPFAGEALMSQALAAIREKFVSIDSIGPVAVADFFDNEVGEARARRIRDAFERVGRFLRELGP